MQILFDVRLLGRGGTSGIEEYSRNLLHALLALDKTNQYTLFYNGLRKKPLNLNLPEVDWHLPNKLLDFSARFLDFPRIDNYVKTDLIFSPHFNILSVDKTPRVITFHDLSFLHHPDFFSWKQKFWHWLQNIKKQAQQAERIIAVSEFTKGDLVNLLGIPPEKISVIYSGISEEFCKIASGSALAMTAGETRNDGRPYILYLGTLEPRKNVPAIIRAFNLLKQKPVFNDWQLVIAGRPGWLFNSIVKEAAASPYGEDIIFRGAVNSEERVSLYNLARVFVYPSFFEGFGFPPLEAQASGCPVVVSDRASLPEIVGESALLVNPWKIEDLASAIEQAAINDQLRGKLIKMGQENVKRFVWSKAAKETLEVFKHAGQ